MALDETAQQLRLGSCKRSAAALVADLGRFDCYVARFLHAFHGFSQWQVEKVAIATYRSRPTNLRLACSEACPPASTKAVALGPLQPGGCIKPLGCARLIR
jgi:hypothetical protein